TDAVNRGRDAGVDDTHFRPGIAGEQVQGRYAGEEVGNHLRGHLLRVGGHLLGGYAVVGGGDDDHRAQALGHMAADLDDAHADLLEPAEAAARLRLPVVEVHVRLKARPATTKYASSAAAAQAALTRPRSSR